jgi:hypothetical protein
LNDQKSRPKLARFDDLAERSGIARRCLDAIISDPEARAHFHPRHVSDTTRIRPLIQRALKSEEVIYRYYFTSNVGSNIYAYLQDLQAYAKEGVCAEELIKLEVVGDSENENDDDDDDDDGGDDDDNGKKNEENELEEEEDEEDEEDDDDEDEEDDDEDDEDDDDEDEEDDDDEDEEDDEDDEDEEDDTVGEEDEGNDNEGDIDDDEEWE